MELCIKSDAKNGQQYQKGLLVVNELLSKIGIGFISNFLLKARVFVLPECLSKSVAFHPRTVKQIVTMLMRSLVFRCFSHYLTHLRTLAQEKRSENCLRFGPGGPSLC